MKTLYVKFKGSCIYTIFNKSNGKQYIGSAKHFAHRMAVHKHQLSNGSHHSVYLQRAWNKYGSEAFEITIMEECSIDSLIEREQYFIDLYKPEYNMSPKAGSSMGRITTEETKIKLKAARKLRSYKGENNPCAKLTWDIVNEIRGTYKPGDAPMLANKHGVQVSAIYRIISNVRFYDPNYVRGY